jgi:hypothetical protein
MDVRLEDSDPAEAVYPGGIHHVIPGQIGGKARGLMYAARMQACEVRLAGGHSALVRIPESYLVGTDLFDAFLEAGEVADAVRTGDYEAIRLSFLRAEVPPRYRAPLDSLAERLSCPLAVRSSSLLEDSPEHSFAGLYLTLFLAGNGTVAERRSALEDAMKRVLASVYNPDAEAYRRKHGLHVAAEKMALLVQPVVGRRRGNLFYPLVSGVAFSKNFYPWTDRLLGKEGVVRVVFGLGTRAVGRNYARVFSLSDPRLRPEGPAIRDILKYSQEVFDAIDLDAGATVSRPACEALSEPDNELHKISSVLRDEGYLVESHTRLGPESRFVLSFDPLILSDRYFPFTGVIRSLLERLEGESGMPVDIEFALELGGDAGRTLELLQFRAMGNRPEHRRVSLAPVDANRLLVDSRRALGNGVLEGIRDIVFVPPEEYRRERADQVRREISELNRELAGRRYILIGPGGWG